MHPVHGETVSIPFWSDFNIASEYSVRVKTRFQSHFGLILTRTIYLEKFLNVMVSIPFWSDFNVQKHHKGFGMEKKFQSHFGLILTYLRKKSR